MYLYYQFFIGRDIRQLLVQQYKQKGLDHAQNNKFPTRIELSRVLERRILSIGDHLNGGINGDFSTPDQIKNVATIVHKLVDYIQNSFIVHVIII